MRKLARAAFKGIKILLLALLGLLSIVVAAALALVIWPQLVINDANLARVPGLARKAGIHARWAAGHVEVESLGLLSKRVGLELTDLCVRLEDGSFDGCWDRLRVGGAAGFGGLKPRVLEIGPVEADGGRVAVRLAQEAEEKKPEEKSKDDGNPLAVPELLAQAKVLPIRVEIVEWKVEGAGGAPIEGRLDVESATGEGGQARVRAELAARRARDHLRALLNLENARGFWSVMDWKATARASGGLRDGTVLGLDARVDPRGEASNPALEYQVEASYRAGRRAGGGRAELQARGEVAADRLTARLDATAHRMAPQLARAWVRGCELRLERAASEEFPGVARLRCPVGATVPLPPKGFPNVKIPTEAGALVRADLRTGAFPPAPDAAIDGKASLELDPILTPVFEGRGRVASELRGVPSEFPRGWKMDTVLGLGVKVPSFEVLVRQLENTPFDVWAPFRSLRGRVELAVDGRFDAASGKAPVSFVTRLASKKQKLDIDARGEVTLKRLRPSPAAHLRMDVALSDVRLQLPPLPELPSVGAIAPDQLPRYFPDSRIRRSEKKPAGGKGEPSALTYEVTVRTPDPAHPVRLLTPQIESGVPLGLELALNDGSGGQAPMSGAVRVMKFPLELFKRQVELNHLTIGLREPSPESTLDGAIVVPYTDYTITVLLLGTTGRPRVRFMSDPPLPEQQILATLIFGQPVDALDPDQSRSVGEAQAALASGAMSLASLYLLGSFNVESLTYDPETKTAAMRYRIAEGTSLNLSRDGEESRVGIRKRLTKNLAITTALNTPTEQSTRSTVSTFLEWTYQY